MRKAKVNINTEKLEASSEIMRALAHPLRLTILHFLDENGEVNVNQIYNTLNLEQSITSQHLRILRLADLVVTSRKGKFIHYSVNYARLENTNKAVRAFLETERRILRSGKTKQGG